MRALEEQPPSPVYRLYDLDAQGYVRVVPYNSARNLFMTQSSAYGYRRKLPNRDRVEVHKFKLVRID